MLDINAGSVVLVGGKKEELSSASQLTLQNEAGQYLLLETVNIVQQWKNSGKTKAPIIEPLQTLMNLT